MKLVFAWEWRRKLSLQEGLRLDTALLLFDALVFKCGVLSEGINHESTVPSNLFWLK